jgi:hypothetical protein
MPRSSSNSSEPDFWRKQDFWYLMRTRPAQHVTYHECTPESAHHWAGSIYVLYNSRTTNKIYFGSTLQGYTKRRAYHLDDAYGNKLGMAPVQQWMRLVCPTRQEAEAQIKLTVVHSVYFSPTATEEEKNNVLKDIEKDFINKYYHTGRLLNVNLLNHENRAHMVAMILKGGDLNRYDIIYKIAEIIDVLKEEGKADALRMLESLHLNLLGGLSEEDV